MQTQLLRAAPRPALGNRVASQKQKSALRCRQSGFTFRHAARAASIGIARSHRLSLALSYHSRRAVHGMPFNASSVLVFGQ
jgi:hypothetical protein